MKERKSARRLTLSEYIYQLNPLWETGDWVQWPPDTFALTSIILGDSGTYRYAVSPPKLAELWPEADWGDRVEEVAKEWREYTVSNGVPLPKSVADGICELEKLSGHVLLHDLYSASKLGRDSDEWRICRLLLELHAYADETCRGFGILAAPPDEPGRLPLVLAANLQLATRGTLSRLPKQIGLVLPKMRVPQIGLTLRSLSHHLTFHRSEADISWRAFPWLNIDENTINIMVMPWPYTVSAKFFKPRQHPGTSEQLGPARYFTYQPKHKEEFDTDLVIELLRKAEREANRVHVLIFPEASLTKSNLDLLRKRLIFAYKDYHDRIPIIIAGLHEEASASEGAVLSNRVSLSALYAQKWYELSQDKHHRWRLDGRQIKRYGLGGVLPGNKSWWEAINIPKRQLSFIAPNGWLTLCPLICEDLARQDPVSELIRGVGPTLLIAILLDGPQLKERWSARYASVLADDPGTSVLTVTSLGMALRSKRVNGGKASNDKDDASRVVALWKDQVSGWEPIEISEGDGAVVLNIAASWQNEYTADGRADGVSAAVFDLQGVSGVPLPDENSTGVGRKEGLPKDGNEKDIDSMSTLDGYVSMSDKHDMIELSIWTYFVDAALDADISMIEKMKSWVVPGEDTGHGLALGDELDNLIQESMRRYKDEHETDTEIPTAELRYAIVQAAGMIIEGRSNGEADESKSLTERWRSLFGAAQARLKNLGPWFKAKDLDNIFRTKTRSSAGKGMLEFIEEVNDPLRIEVAIPQSIFWAIHNRLTKQRRKGTLTPEGAKLLTNVEEAVKKGVPEDLAENLHNAWSLDA